MANAILPSGEQQFSDADGKPYVGGKVYFYIPNTLTPKNTYQDQDSTILNTNPVILDSAGRAVIWGEGNYRQILNDKNGNTVWDRIVSYLEENLSGPSGSEKIGFTQSGTDASQRSVQDKLRTIFDVKDFGAIGDGVNDDTVGLQRAIDAAFAIGANEVLFPYTEDFYLITKPLIMRRGVSLRGMGNTKPLIRNLNTPYNFYYSSFVVAGNFHPDFVMDVVGDALDVTVADTNSVTLTTLGDAANYSIGAQVLIKSDEVYVSSGYNINKYLYINEVTGISGAVLTLKYPIDQSFAGRIANMAGNYPGREGNPLFFWQDGGIENLSFDGIGYLHADSAMLGCTIKNVDFRGRSFIYGNTFQYTNWKKSCDRREG